VDRLVGKTEWVSWVHLINGYTELGELDLAFECAHCALERDRCALGNAVDARHAPIS
jgi:hypothetical protein